jgi:hypothetical protein
MDAVTLACPLRRDPLWTRRAADPTVGGDVFQLTEGGKLGLAGEDRAPDKLCLTTGKPDLFLSYLRRHSALSRASSRQTGGNELERAANFFPSRVLPIYSFSGRRPRMYKPVAVRSDSRSTLHGHAAAYG